MQEQEVSRQIFVSYRSVCLLSSKHLQLMVKKAVEEEN